MEVAAGCLDRVRRTESQEDDNGRVKRVMRWNGGEYEVKDLFKRWKLCCVGYTAEISKSFSAIVHACTRYEKKIFLYMGG